MFFGKEREILGRVSENFSVRVLDREQGLVNEAICKALTGSGRWHKRNCPLKPVLIVWLVIMMALYRDKSIPNVFRRMIGLLKLGEEDEGLSLRPVTPEALHHARRRLGSEPLRFLFEDLAGQRCWTETHFNGHRVVAVDGSYFRIPDTHANEEFFGRKKSNRGDAGYPQMQSVALVDIATHKVLDVEFQHCNGSERDGLKKVLDRHLGTGDLLILDQGLPSYEIFSLCESCAMKFLARLSSTWKPKFVEQLGPGDVLVEISPGKVTKKQLKAFGGKRNKALRLRLLSYEIEEGETVRLVTNLLCPKQYPAREIGLFYHERWEIELVYDELKTHFAAVSNGKQPTHFRSKRPDGVLQEAYGMMIAFNLIRDLMVEAARSTKDTRPLQLSFVDTIETVKVVSPQFETKNPSNLRSAHLELLREVSACKLRPRRKRRYPRAVKIKMSNYKRKRGRGGGEHFDAVESFRLVPPPGLKKAA